MSVAVLACSRRAVCGALACGLLAMTPVGVEGQCDGGSGAWTVGVGQEAAGPLGSANAMIHWDPDGDGPLASVLVVGGSFRVAGTVLASNIATWDGVAWASLGAGFNGQVEALAVYNGQLIAAGSFTNSGATACNRIARWNGASWEPLGAGLNDTVAAMAIYNGRLYAGGSFTTAAGLPANRIASWDGAVWRPLGTGGAGGGGGVERLATNPVGYTPRVAALTVFNGYLIVGGTFDQAGSTANTGTLARWNGSAWSGMGQFTDDDGGIPLPRVLSLAVHSSAIDASSTLYVGGDFASVDGVAADSIARYPATVIDQGPWSAVGGGFPGDVTALLIQPAGPLTYAVIANVEFDFDTDSPGGLFRLSAGVWNQFAPERSRCLINYSGVVAGIRGVSRRVGSDWLPLADGLNLAPRFIVSYDGDLHAFGSFTAADQQVVNGAARLDDSGWHPLGSGVLVPSGLTSIFDVALFDDQIFVIGSALGFQNASIRRAMRWNGTTWLAAGDFLFTGNTGLGLAGGNLYATVDSSVYRWNGIGWQAVGPALPQNRAEGVVWWNNQLHAYGYDLYRFDGAGWQFVADNPSLFLDESLAWNGRLFLSTSTQGPGSVVELIGSDLVTILPDVFVSDFIEFDGRLLATLSSALAEYDGTDWSFHSIFTGGAGTLAIHKGQLIVAGTETVDGMVSPIFARLVCCPADLDGDSDVDVFDLLIYLDRWFADAPAADIDGTPGVDVFDLLTYLDGWFAGC